MDIQKLRELLEDNFGPQAMVYKDLFALGCWLHVTGNRAVGEKMVKQVLASVPKSGNREYLKALGSNLAGNEVQWDQDIFAHYEVNQLFVCEAAPAQQRIR